MLNIWPMCSTIETSAATGVSCERNFLGAICTQSRHFLLDMLVEIEVKFFPRGLSTTSI